MTNWRIEVGDCRDVLRRMPAGSVHTVVTSPPYFGLRDYGAEGQIGLEPTPDEFVAALVDVFRKVRRVLRDHGTVWLNLGDSYAHTTADIKPHTGGGMSRPGSRGTGVTVQRKALGDAKPKDLLGIPWMVAFALRADGWYLRSDIVWSKPNPMPESVTDRPTKSHEFVFLLSKGPRYFYDADAIREDAEPSGWAKQRAAGVDTWEYGKAAGGTGVDNTNGVGGTFGPGGRNKRSVWTVATQPYAGAHFATFPPKLIEPCILAGAPERACGECGAPWVRVVERTPRVPWEERKAAGAGRGNVAFNGNVGAGTQRGVHGEGVSNDLTTEVRTLGFKPSCLHGGKERVSQESSEGRGRGRLGAPPDVSGACLATGEASAQAQIVPGVVLDPFAGAGTTGLVALQHGREFVGIELSPAYAQMARDRISAWERCGFRNPANVATPPEGQESLFSL